MSFRTGNCSKCGGEPKEHLWKGGVWLIDGKCTVNVEPSESEKSVFEIVMSHYGHQMSSRFPKADPAASTMVPNRLEFYCLTCNGAHVFTIINKECDEICAEYDLTETVTPKK